MTFSSTFPALITHSKFVQPVFSVPQAGSQERMGSCLGPSPTLFFSRPDCLDGAGGTCAALSVEHPTKSKNMLWVVPVRVLLSKCRLAIMRILPPVSANKQQAVVVTVPSAHREG